MLFDPKDAQRYVLADRCLPMLSFIKECISHIEIQIRVEVGVFEALSRTSPKDYPMLILMAAFEDSAESIARCAQLSRQGGQKGVPLVVIGPAHSPALRAQCFRAGVIDYIENSATSEEINIRLRMHLQTDEARCPAAVSNVPTKPATSRNHEIYRLAIQYLSSREIDEISKRSLAQKVGVSEANLEAAFRSETGSSVVNFLKQRRSERACALLRTSSMSITTIAELLGFSGGANFATAFRHSFGEAPSRFRFAHSRETDISEV